MATTATTTAIEDCLCTAITWRRPVGRQFMSTCSLPAARVTVGSKKEEGREQRVHSRGRNVGDFKLALAQIEVRSWKQGGVMKWLGVFRVACLLLTVCGGVGLLLGEAAAQAQQTPSTTPPPAKVQELIKLLDDPDIRAWLQAKARAGNGRCRSRRRRAHVPMGDPPSRPLCISHRCGSPARPGNGECGDDHHGKGQWRWARNSDRHHRPR